MSTEAERRKLEKSSLALGRQISSLSASKDAIDAQLESATEAEIASFRVEMMAYFGEAFSRFGAELLELTGRFEALEQKNASCVNCMESSTTPNENAPPRADDADTVPRGRTSEGKQYG